MLLLGFTTHKILAQKALISDSDAVEKTIQEVKTSGFNFIDLEITPEEKTLINQLKFNKLESNSELRYDHYGNLELLEEGLTEYFNKIGNNDSLVVAALTQTILRSTSGMIKATKKPTAWVSVRASTPHHGFDIPRWHLDSYFGIKSKNSESKEAVFFKFVATLIGPSTLLYNLPSENRKEFLDHVQNRSYLNMFLDIKNAQSADNETALAFLVADNNKAAIHSEPKTNTHRVFFAIIVGYEDEIARIATQDSHNVHKKSFIGGKPFVGGTSVKKYKN